MEAIDSPDDEMRRWIAEHMTADPATVVKEQRERAAKFASVAKDGSVVVKPNDKFTARHKILAVFVGKLYAETAGYATEAVVGYPELSSTLSLPDGTIRPMVKELRDDRLIETVENGRYKLLKAALRRALDELESASE